MVILNFKHKLKEDSYCVGCPMLNSSGNFCSYYNVELKKQEVHYQAYELKKHDEFPIRCENCIDEQGI